MLEIDEMVEIVKNCKYLPERDILNLCSIVQDILLDEPNIVMVSSPVTVCGDIHGQFYDLEELFRTGGQIPSTAYIFMGDFVDRGYYSLETITRLLTLKARYPDRITLLRGNHESRQITQVYGFYDECVVKYGNSTVWKFFCKIFDLLAISALIDNEVFCVHGGLSPYIKSLDQISLIQRNIEIPNKGAFCDLMWSDPEEVENWETSQRGAGWLFGAKITNEFLQSNSLSLICRAHQLVNEGIQYHFNKKLVTVWSAPNYCYRCGNVAAILQFETAKNYHEKIFSAVPNTEQTVPPKNIIP